MGAVWLLILCGSIASILMLRSLEKAKGVAAQEQALQARLALDGAVELVAADLLFNGWRSAWGLLPVRGTVVLAGVPVEVRLSSESGRIDLNHADPVLIDTALNGLGAGPAERRRLLTRLAAARGVGRPVATFSGMRALLMGVGTRGDICLNDQFTPMSGLAVPRSDQMPAALARALAIPAQARAEARAGPEANIRVEARIATGEALTAIVRTAPSAERPYRTSAWEYVAACPASAGPAARR